MSEAVFHPEFRSDLRYWKGTDRLVARRILDLVDAVLTDPYSGPGNPSPLVAALEGCWCRRIEQEHRLVYRIDGNRIEFLQARYQY